MSHSCKASASPRVLLTMIGATFALSAYSAAAAPAYAAICQNIALLNDNPAPTGDQATQARQARRGVVVTAEDGIFQPGQADFSLSRTLGQIIRTSGAVDTPAERASMLQSIVRSFNLTRHENPDSGTEFTVQARPEATLDPADLLDPASSNFMHPVGLFNRFDLADENFETCGQHRIVYALGDGQNALHRWFHIYEAAYPNPAPILGQTGCLPIVNFWKGLETVDDPAELASRLEEFYYLGLDLDGDDAPDIAPVVQFDHFGTRGGQFRTNNFITGGNPGQNPWQLREWLLGRNLDGSPTFTVETVKDNPAIEFYRLPVDDEHPDLTVARGQFRDQLLSQNLFNLQPELDGKTLPHQITATLSGGFDNAFNDFESVSQTLVDDPGDGTDPALSAMLQARLNTFTGIGLTAEQLVNRAGAATCGGCHDFSKNKPIGNGITWPAPVPPGFVHINESGVLSAALIDDFLPFRCEVLDAAAGTAASASMTVTAENQDALNIKEADDVTQAEQAFKIADTPQQRASALARLENAVNADRTRRDNTPGAFMRVRRVH